MTIPNVPFWFSDAMTEIGEGSGYISDPMGALLGAAAGHYVSELAGHSAAPAFSASVADVHTAYSYDSFTEVNGSVVINGGQAPYTYTWNYFAYSGSIVAAYPDILGPGTLLLAITVDPSTYLFTSQVNCTVTDSLGATATSNTATWANY